MAHVVHGQKKIISEQFLVELVSELFFVKGIAT